MSIFNDKKCRLCVILIKKFDEDLVSKKLLIFSVLFRYNIHRGDLYDIKT